MKTRERNVKEYFNLLTLYRRLKNMTPEEKKKWMEILHNPKKMQELKEGEK